MGKTNKRGKDNKPRGTQLNTEAFLEFIWKWFYNNNKKTCKDWTPQWDNRAKGIDADTTTELQHSLRTTVSSADNRKVSTPSLDDHSKGLNTDKRNQSTQNQDKDMAANAGWYTFTGFKRQDIKMWHR